MARHQETGFDKFVDDQMKQPSFARSYRDARWEVDAVDRIVRLLDSAREQLGWSKAELARAVSARPEIVRKLFAGAAPNPTISTVVRLAHALGYEVQLVRAGTQMEPVGGGSRPHAVGG